MTTPTGSLRASFASRDVARSGALLLTALVVGALAAELALRVYVRVGGRAGQRIADYDPLRVQVVPYGVVGYRQRPHAKFHYENGTVASANSLGYRGPEITRAKPPGTVRIVLMGGSTTHGWGVNDDQTIDAYMRKELSARSKQPVEVINAALDGYDSRQILERMRSDVLQLDPDIVIVNGGINDVRNARFDNLVEADPRTLIWRAPMQRMRHEQVYGPSWWTLAKHYSLLLRLPSYVVTRVQQKDEEKIDVPIYDDAADHFEHNMRSIARIAGNHNITLIFSTPPSSLRLRYAPDAPPEKAYWVKDAETTARYRDTLAARMQKVVGEVKAQGRPVLYLSPQLPATQFLDDAHLTAEGNAAIATAFTEAALRLLRH